VPPDPIQHRYFDIYIDGINRDSVGIPTPTSFLSHTGPSLAKNEAEKSGFPPREYEPPGKGIEKLGELEKRGLQGGFHKMSYFGAKTVIWAHFWVEKRDFMSFVGQLWSILVIL